MTDSLHRILVRPYGAVLWFTTDVNAFLEYRAHYTKETLDLSNADGVSSDFEGAMVHIVGVFNNSIETLVHELVHVCFKLLYSVNVPVNAQNNEAFAYLLGDLLKETRLFLINTTQE